MKSNLVGLLGRAVALGLTLGLLAGWTANAGEPIAKRTHEVLSPVYTVDREYRSMMGPSNTSEILLPESASPELLWITGYRATMVAEDGRTPVSQEYMCHSNLDFDRERHARLFDLPVYHTDRLFTLSQGQYEIDLPGGFGLPYYSDEPFWLTTQVLNLNPDESVHRVRHKVTIDYVVDGESAAEMKPLFMTSAWGLVLLEGEDGPFGVEEAGEEHEGCLPGEAASEDMRDDGLGRRFSGHWVVPPGRQVNRTRVTTIMKLPYDTTVHYIAVHLHPFAESLELIDLTDGKSVFKSQVAGAEGKIGIERVDYFSSAEGIPLHADHEYELVSTYENTTRENQDSMAVMLLYLLDREFEKPISTDLSEF